MSETNFTKIHYFQTFLNLQVTQYKSSLNNIQQKFRKTFFKRDKISNLKHSRKQKLLQAVRSEVQKRLPKEWSEEEIAQLTELWEQLKNDDGNSLKENKTTNYSWKILSNEKRNQKSRRIYFTSQRIHLALNIFDLFVHPCTFLNARIFHKNKISQSINDEQKREI